MMEQKQRINFKPHIIAAVISLVIGAIIFCLIYFLRSRAFTAAIDGTSYAGIALIGLALLVLIARFGSFDIFAYGFKQLGASMFNKQASKYNDFPGYKQEKNLQRSRKPKYYYSILLVGLLYLISSIILILILESM